MRHKSGCPKCGRLAYLRARIIGSDDKSLVPYVVWMCDECYPKSYEGEFMPVNKVPSEYLSER